MKPNVASIYRILLAVSLGVVSIFLWTHSARALTGAINRSYIFQAQTTDPESDPLYYNFNWGDGTPETRSPASGTVPSGTTVSASHAWTASGNYSIYVAACDVSQCSLQSNPFVMSIQPPSTPGKPLMTVGANPTASGKFTLEWDPSDPHSITSVPVSISQYDVYRQLNSGSWTLAGSVTSPKYVENGLPDGTYKYYTVARDDTVPTNFSPASPPSGDIVVDSSLGANPPTADFDWCLLSANTVQFEDRSIDIDGTVAAWDWDLGDGTTTAQQHPYHTYAGGGAGSGDPWWDASWTRRRKIIIDNSAVTAALANFPILVKLTSARIDYNQTNNTGPDAGYDIRFTNDTGTQALNFEIEKWKDAADTSYVWVNVPSIPDSSSPGPYIWMYYGYNPAPGPALPLANRQATWDASFAAVWHLPEDPSGAAPQIKDSTANNNHGASNGAMASADQVAGKVDGSLDFDGTDDSLQIPGLLGFPQPPPGSPTNITLSAWANLRTPDIDGGEIVSLGDRVLMRLDDGSDNMRVYAWSGSGWQATSYLATFAGTGWHNFAYTFDDVANVQKLYVDGIEQASSVHPLSIDYAGAGTDTFIGKHGNGQVDYDFNGIIDEVSVANTVRSANWIATQYKSMNDALLSNTAPSFVEEIYTSSGWWNSAWTKRRKITFDNSSQAQTLANFPVLVTLTAPGRIDYGQTQDQGQDIRFVDADGTTVLAHEIEQWSESGSSYMWVKVPQIDASSNTDYVWMYYGNASAPDGQDIAGTWDASFKGVWHLKEASGQHQDSTSNANNSSSLIVTQQGTAAGKIDGTDQFDGTDDRIQIPDSASLDQVTTQVTLEGWFKTNGSDTDGFVANKKDPPVANGYQIALEGGNPVGRVNGMPIPCSPVLSGNDNQWHYAALTYSSGGSAALWIDGASCNSSSGGSGSVANNQLFVIGEEGDYNDANPGGWFLNGTIDEVRVSNTVRSSAWIAAQYKSMKDDGLAPFVTFSAEELPPSGGPYTVVLTVMDNGGTFSTPASKVVDLTASPNCIFTHTDTVATKCTEIALQWTPAQAASSYTIFRSDSAGPWTQRFSNVSSVFYYDTTVSPLSSYQYYVQAVIPAGTLNASTNAPACTGGWSGNPPPHTFCPHPVPALSTPECAPILDPLPPTSPCGAITLTWLPAVGATSYSVFRNTVSDFATATKLASGLTVTTYLDTTVVPEVVYYYYVTNQNGVNPSNEEYSKSSCFRGTRWQER